MVKNLRELRLNKKISQQQLASVLGTSQQSINKYENHDVEPDIAMLCAMADYFGTTVDHLIGRNDHTDFSLSLSQTEKDMIVRYRRLSDTGQTCVRTVLKALDDPCDR